MTVQDQLAIAQNSYCVVDRITSIAERNPDQIAVVMGDQSMTYEELNKASNRLANEIVENGCGVGDIVGIVIERSVQMVVAILAVMKSGAAYAAIDSEYPPERVAQMCAAIPMSLILTTEKGLGMRPPFGAPRLHLDRQSDRINSRSDSFVRPIVSPDDLVYVVFTSGSTGTPKATAVHQAGWANLMQWFIAEFGIGAKDRNLIISSFSFDITQRAIVMPLLVGGQLHLCPFPTIDADALLSLIERAEITLINCAPSAFYPLAENANSAAAGRLRWLFLGGEPINAARIRGWAESDTTRTGVVNVYGTAECSDVSTFHVLKDYDRYISSSVPAGLPIFNTSILLLNEDGSETPAGETGEIVIGGVGVGKGYINDPSSTEKKFILDPNNPEKTVYRTGDRGRWLENIGLIFDGRVDYQVKIRGNRVDLGEVEALLRKDVRIRDAVALRHVTSRGDEVLLAFVLLHALPGDGEDLAVELRRAMSRRAPGFLVPSEFEFLTEFPLNPNGKVDRKALSNAIGSGRRDTTELNGLTAVEAKISDVFCRILGVRHVGRDDIFFDLGGYSALVTEALAEINNELDSAISIYDFLSGPTVRELAQHVPTANIAE